MKSFFYKMHGLGNDFVIIDNRASGGIPNEPLRRKIADRHRGVGCDQLIVITPPEDQSADLFMHIYNPDGSEAGACGNATRCVARLWFKETKKIQGIVQTISGFLPVWEEGDNRIAVDFGAPRLDWEQIPLAEPMDTLKIEFKIGDYADPCCVNMGNPHAVFFVRDAAAVPLENIGPKIERAALFPQRTNVEFANIIDPQRIRMRVWERGAGVTQSCGSGACATLVAAVRRGLSSRRATIVLDGGELTVSWRENDNHVILSGGTTLAYTGQFDNELYA